MLKQTLIFSFLCLFSAFIYAQTSPKIIAKGKNKGKIEVSSTSGNPNLYLQTGNMIIIDIPSLSDKSKLNCTINGGKMNQSSEDKTKFLVVPTKSPVTITVNNGTNQMGEIVYEVVEPPKPTLEWYINGVKIKNLHKVVKTDKLTVRVVPQKDFSEKYPNDAKYSLGGVDVWIVCDSIPKRVGGADLSKKNAVIPFEVPIPTGFFEKTGDCQVMVKIKDVNRRTFEGDAILDKRFTEEEKTFYLTK